MNKDTLNLTASAVFMVALLGLLVYLTTTPIPTSNKDVVLALVGAMVGGMAAAMPKLFGSFDTDVKVQRDTDRREIQDLKEKVKVLEAAFTTLKSEYDRVVNLLVERHVVQGKGIAQKDTK